MGFYDMHCHIIPNVDDGSKSIEMSMEILKKEYEAGVDNIILTPHYRIEMFETSTEEIQRQYNLLCQRSKSELPQMHLHLGCEFHAHLELLDTLNKHSEYRMAGSEYVLLEFSSLHPSFYMRDRVKEMLENGYEVIIAHCERYEHIRNNFNFACDLVDMGAYLQVNAGSIIGKEGWKTKVFCKKLMKNDMIGFIGSDVHNITTRPTYMAECISYVTRKMGRRYAKRLFFERPDEIIN